MLRSKFKVALVLWLVAEVTLVVFAVRLLGWPTFLLVSLVATGFGFYLLARAGRQAILFLNMAARNPGELSLVEASAGAARVLSGILLVVPGFLSDLAGLALLSPWVRNRFLRRFFAGSGPARTRDVDLRPDEWRRSE